jgi:hypothetical protein
MQDKDIVEMAMEIGGFIKGGGISLEAQQLFRKSAPWS